ncbi:MULTISPECIES: DUF4113 domain-containing protein [Pseudomonas syringae group genomosp. 2]
MGQGAMRFASQPVDAIWGMHRDIMTRSLTTRADELWTVYCG